MGDRESHEIALFEMERSAASVDVVAAMFRDAAGGWKLRIIDRPAQNGQHFMDILPLLSEVIREFIPRAPSRQKVAFAMEKGGVLDLPMNLGLITVGLGWDVDDGECDLDVSAVPSSSHDFTVMKSLNRDYFCTADPLNITYSSLVILLHSCVVAGDVQEATDINSACL